MKNFDELCNRDNIFAADTNTAQGTKVLSARGTIFLRQYFLVETEIARDLLRLTLHVDDVSV